MCISRTRKVLIKYHWSNGKSDNTMSERPYDQQNTAQKTNRHNIIGILMNVVSNTTIIEW